MDYYDIFFKGENRKYVDRSRWMIETVSKRKIIDVHLFSILVFIPIWGTFLFFTVFFIPYLVPIYIFIPALCLPFILIIPYHRMTTTGLYFQVGKNHILIDPMRWERVVFDAVMRMGELTDCVKCGKERIFGYPCYHCDPNRFLKRFWEENNKEKGSKD